MPLKLPTLRLSGTDLAAGAAAGVAAVLLAMLTLQRPPATLALGFVSPLPLMIAALAFGPASGALAVVIGTIFVAIFDMKLGQLVLATRPSGVAALTDSLVFLVGLGIPAWLASLLARLPTRPPRAADGPPRMRPDEARLSRVVVATILFAIVGVALMYGVAIVAYGGLAAFDATMVSSYEEVLKAAAQRNAGTLTGQDLHRTAGFFAALLPWMMAAFAVVFYLLNLWLAARIARLSGVFGTEWPDIPRNLRLPRLAAAAFAIFLGLSFLRGPFGLLAHIVTAALFAGFCLQGLAVVHAMTRDRSWRVVALVFTYGLVPFVFWGLLGLLDTAFSFRDRQAPIVRKQTERKDPWK